MDPRLRISPFDTNTRFLKRIEVSEILTMKNEISYSYILFQCTSDLFYLKLFTSSFVLIFSALNLLPNGV